MHLRWTRRQLLTNRQMGEQLCPHDWINQPITLAPAVVHQNKPIWYPSCTIRECCVEDETDVALAAWWWEVRNRFEDLNRVGIEDPIITKALLEQLSYIEDLLEETVPKPTQAAWEAYGAQHSKQKRRIRQNVLTSQLNVLGLRWPCTLEEVKKRWREVASQHHPDRGGDQKTFIRMKTAYEKIAAKMAV